MGLDTVELILGWEEAFGIEIDDAASAEMRTTNDVIDYVYEKVKTDLKEDEGSLTIRAFMRIRSALREKGIQRKIGLQVRVSDILSGKKKRDQLSAIMTSVGLEPPGRLPFDVQLVFSRVRDLVTGAVIGDHRRLRKENHAWSRSQVREVVRAVMFFQLHLRQFSDEAEIVRDLGVE